jgi:hypothetical protein
MRRAFGYTGAWLMATSAAITVSWFGCAVVLNGASPPAPAVLSPVEAGNVLGLPGPLASATLGAQRTGQAAAATVVPPRTTPPRASRGTRPDPTPTSFIPTTTRHTAPPARSTPPPNPGATPTPTATALVSPDPDATVHTVQTDGGEATLRFTPDGVEVVGLDPAAGYDWYVDQTRPEELWVIFGQVGHEFDLYATWNEGPSASVTEYQW